MCGICRHFTTQNGKVQRANITESNTTSGQMRLNGTMWESKMAERVGFEPTVQLPVLRFSRPALSSTQPSLREWNRGWIPWSSGPWAGNLEATQCPCFETTALEGPYPAILGDLQSSVAKSVHGGKMASRGVWQAGMRAEPAVLRVAGLGINASRGRPAWRPADLWPAGPIQPGWSCRPSGRPRPGPG